MIIFGSVHTHIHTFRRYELVGYYFGEIFSVFYWLVFRNDDTYYFFCVFFFFFFFCNRYLLRVDILHLFQIGLFIYIILETFFFCFTIFLFCAYYTNQFLENKKTGRLFLFIFMNFIFFSSDVEESSIFFLRFDTRCRSKI